MAQYVNDRKMLTHNGAKFQSNTIKRILQNPIYCGYYNRGGVTSKRVKELQIIDDAIFDEAQKILEQRKYTNEKKTQLARTAKSSTMLGGNIYCAHCGKKLCAKSYYENQAKKCGRISEYSLDSDNKRAYAKRAEVWQEKADEVSEKLDKSVANSETGGIMKLDIERTAVSNVYKIGEIDIEKYKCVTNDILTNEVVITDPQIAHIRERHPNDYERYFKYVAEILKYPDYILEANRPNTAFILKHVTDNDKRYQLILRLKTSNDPKHYKNSVITFLKVEEKRYNRYLRTKKILYKSE